MTLSEAFFFRLSQFSLLRRVSGERRRCQREQLVRPTDEDLETLVQTYADSLYRLCFSILGNRADAEDAVSDVIVRYMTKAPVFTDENHRKAWLLRTAVNRSRDMLRFRKRRNHLELDNLRDCCVPEEDTGILEDLFSLPEKYRTVLHLYYVEGYRTGEIAALLELTPAAVRKRLQIGREKLRLVYEQEESL